jgi:hypothetical protein
MPNALAAQLAAIATAESVIVCTTMTGRRAGPGFPAARTTQEGVQIEEQPLHRVFGR